MKIVNLILLLSFFIFSIKSHSQELDATFIELNKGGGIYPKNIIKTNSGFYFTGLNSSNINHIEDTYRELWFSDGTKEGTYLVKDIISGNEGANPKELTLLNNTLFFVGKSENTDFSLYKTDGTADGTTIITDSFSNEFTDENKDLIVYNNQIYFSHNNEIWTTDGSFSNAHKVLEQESFYKFIFNDELYFFGKSSIVSGFGLWKTNGTMEGTVSVYYWDSNVNKDDFNIIINENDFYFLSLNPNSGDVLWKSDGTTQGTMLVKNITENETSLSHLNGTNLNGEILFLSPASNVSEIGFDLWKTNGTEEGTILLKSFPQSDFTNRNIALKTFNNEVYFYANDGIYGNEIWKSDGTMEGTVLVKDHFSDENQDIFISDFYVDELNNQLFFFGNTSNPEDFKTLWTTDGTEEGTHEFSNKLKIKTTSIFFTFNGKTVFSAYSDLNGYELWELHENPEEISVLFESKVNADSEPNFQFDLEDKIYFTANQKPNEKKLFYFDASENKIEETELQIGNKNVKLNDDYFSLVNHEIYGREIWKTNFENNSSSLLKDIYSGTASSVTSDNELIVWNGNLYFSADDGISGFQLWKSDGTETGTQILKITNPNGGSYPKNFTIFNNELYFTSNNQNAVKSLWKTNGTETGTVEVLADKSYHGITKLNNKLLLFESSENDFNLENVAFWDGTTKTILQTFNFDYSGLKIKYIESKNEVYFSFLNQENWRNYLYKTDGTIQGTNLVFESETTMDYMIIEDIFECGEHIYFTVGEHINSIFKIWRINNSGVFKIDEENQSYSSIREINCMENHLVYLKGTQTNDIYFLEDGENIPISNTINVLNNEENIVIKRLGKTKYNLFFAAETTKNGEELYVTKPDFLPLENEEFSEIKNDSNFINIFPNPTSFTIQISSKNQKISSFEIYDLKGNLLETKTFEIPISEVNYNIEKYEEGIYILKVKLNNGKIIPSKIFIN
ncbi:T9SS type A sorting domain-containing protein [Aureivirga marina]|uniref:T9SS type A sorting domain-containing protein n=1 Tax=Aureivirga marina TaxID=1182451 RepID=UPI0018CA335E|nr:T9SS type A sorting domain-containing protein [Aureivirga marina]